MSYTKGEAHIDEDYWSNTKDMVIMLPHSCDEWVIGDVQQAQDLVDDLQKLIQELATKPNKDK